MGTSQAQEGEIRSQRVARSVNSEKVIGEGIETTYLTLSNGNPAMVEQNEATRAATVFRFS